MPTLILDILLIYHFEVFRAYPTIPDHNQLIFMNQYVSVDY